MDDRNERDKFSPTHMDQDGWRETTKQEGREVDPIRVWEGIDTRQDTDLNRLVKLAMRVLSVMVNSAGYERAFSHGTCSHSHSRKLGVEKVRKVKIVGMDIKQAHIEAGLLRRRGERNFTMADSDPESEAANHVDIEHTGTDNLLVRLCRLRLCKLAFVLIGSPAALLSLYETHWLIVPLRALAIPAAANIDSATDDPPANPAHPPSAGTITVPSVLTPIQPTHCLDQKDFNTTRQSYLTTQPDRSAALLNEMDFFWSGGIENLGKEMEAYQILLSDMPFLEGASNVNISGGTFIDNYGDPATTERIKAFLDDEERQKTMAWVSPVDVASQHSDVASRRLPGTGQWFLDSDAFKEWERGNGQALWCPGIPGAGKTVLASLVIDELHALQRREPGGSIGVTWFYFNYKEESTQTKELVHCCLVRQLAEVSGKLYAHLKAGYEEARRESSSRLSTSSLEWMPDMHTLTQNFARVFVVVDALDECAESCRDAVLGMMADLLAAGANVLITSRNHLDEFISSKLGNIGRIDIRATHDDIGRYLEARLNEQRRLAAIIGHHPSLRAEIMTAIPDSCQGMYVESIKLFLPFSSSNIIPRFLMATFHIRALESQSNVGEIIDLLKDLPRSFPDIYSDALNRIAHSNHCSQALRALSFLIYARRPLTVPELQHFLAVRTDHTDFNTDYITDGDLLVAACAGLVVIDKKTDIIRLVHLTTQQYFDSIRTTKFPKGDLEMAHTCLAYLSFDTFRNVASLEDQIRGHILLDYVVNYWHAHIQDHQMPLQKPLLTLLKDESLLHAYSFFKNKYDLRYFRTWGRRWGVNGQSGLHVVAAAGLLSGAGWLLEAGSNANSRDSKGFTPLLYACQAEHTQMVRFLISQGASVNASYFGEDITALHFAATSGNNELVDVLLEVGADIDACTRMGVTPLSLASWHGHEPIVRSLLDNGAAIDPPYPFLRRVFRHLRPRKSNADGSLLEVPPSLAIGLESNARNPLWAAVGSGHSTIAYLLFKEGARVDSWCAQEMMHMPCFESDIGATIELMLKLSLPEASVQAEEDRRRNRRRKVALAMHRKTPLHLRVIKGPNMIMRRLLESGSSASTCTANSTSALHIGSELDHPTLVQLLLEQGTAVDSHDSKGSTALQGTEGNGIETDPILLSTNGVAVGMDDAWAQRSFYMALKQGKEAAVQSLLKHGVAVDARTEDGVTALHAAAIGGQESIVSLLLQHGADINAKCIRGDTALHAAAERGHLAVVRLLLERGAMVDAKGEGDNTPLYRAAKSGHGEVVQVLLEHGADINAKCVLGDIALHAAANEGHLPVVCLLLEEGATVNAKCAAGTTPLYRAADWGRDRDEIVWVLLEHGADVNAKCIDGKTALHAAAARSSLAVVRLLLEKGAIVDAKCALGTTPLYEAAEWGWGGAGDETVQVLLGHGADPNAVSGLPKLLAGRRSMLAKIFALGSK
ncbi:hypothetical protein LshimejAT787_2100890 [Lyophyllum shimeji]|uniref:NACHT domain-containing protein n=1 Tax=Lyophyllum shimeji TaxID=47721 RepID=A0A9P3Q1G6_LYOSH|nr:hypothetical protein LshimejAT787_2100890 [Lyophyllum shimeji]